MENKINISKILKDCPKGMELECPMFENLEFDHIDKDNKLYPIRCRVKTEWGSYNFYTFTEYGCYGSEKYSKCVIFPKGKTTWEGFVPPCKFKDGDIVVTKTSSNFIFYSIYQGVENREVLTYVDYYLDGNRLINVSPTLCYTYEIVEQRFATEEEKQKLFDAIKAKGYKWNTESKTLEKLIESNEDVDDKIVMSGIYFDNEYYADEVELHLDNYEIEIRDGKTYAVFKNQENKTLEKLIKPWTIQDAKDGDILAFNDETIIIFKDLYNKTSFHSYCHIEEGIFTISKEDMPDWWEGKGFYPATEEQRTFLFRKIKEAGYKWNAETKTLKKLPKFKVGDRIKYRSGEIVYRIVQITEDSYVLDNLCSIPISIEHMYNLVPQQI